MTIVFHIVQAPRSVEMPGLPQLWKSLDGIPTIAWKTLRVYHNPLEKLGKKLFHIPTEPFVSFENIIRRK